MLVLSIGVFFRGFNPSRFVLYLSLLIFTILLALRLDQLINISLLLVFSPLFACNVITFVGAIFGIVSFICRPPQQNETGARLDFVAMLLTTLEHLLLFSFEYLVIYKLDILANPPEKTIIYAPWLVIFAPLLLESCLAIFISIWAVRHDKSFEFELFFSVNVVQIVFIVFKLDKHVDWSWAVVFIPLWILLSLCVVGVLYALILALLLTRSRHIIPAHRRNHIYSAIIQTLLVVPALITLVLLTGKLDYYSLWINSHSIQELTYLSVALPLMVSLFFLLLMSFCSRGGNIWWYALRRPFCAFLLDSCPCLRQYGNVSYKIGMEDDVDDVPPPPPLMDDIDYISIRPSIPITSIELPD